jgi:hypothetical protein
MHVTLNKNFPIEEVSIEGLSSIRIKNSFFENEKISVLVVGFPYFLESSSWAGAEAIGQHYLKKKVGFIDDLDGVFYILIIDKVDKMVHLIPDALGFYSCYTFSESGQLKISDFIAELPVQKCREDSSSFLQLLHFNFILGEDTLYKEIKKLRGGYVYSIDNQLNIHKNKYWQYGNKQTSTSADYKLAFRKSITDAYKLSSKVALPLTAGLDSRLVLGYSLPYKENITCFTHGQAGNVDLVVARRICEKYRVAHEFYDVGYSNKSFVNSIPLISEEMMEYFECMGNGIRYAHLKKSFLEAAKKYDAIVTGVGGEMVTAYLAQLPSLKGTDFNSPIEAVINDIRNKLAVPATFSLYTIGKSEVIQTLNNCIQKEIDYIQSDEADFLYDYFYLAKLSGFTGSLQKYLGTEGQIFNPYLSKEILTVCGGLDFQFKKGKNLQKEMLLEADKGLGSIPLNEFENPDKSNKLMELVCRANHGSRILKKIVNKLSGKEVFTLFSVNVGKLLLPHNFDFLQQSLQSVNHELIKQEELKFNAPSQVNENYLNQFTALGSLNTWLSRYK